MQRTVIIDGKTYEYEYEIKRVKNINLSINREKSIRVSANPKVPIAKIEDFIIKNKSFIYRAFDKIDKSKESIGIDKNVSKAELELLKVKIESYAKLYFPYFEKKGIKYPEIKYRKMTSRWGSCHYKKGKIVFNAYLCKVANDLTEYVVAHELCHFLEPNHGARFYAHLQNVLPDYKQRRKRLKSVII